MFIDEGSSLVPRLFFTVHSCSAGWRASTASSMQQLEGYGRLVMPVSAGKYSYLVPCWKPSLSVDQRLSAKFTVDDLAIRDLSYLDDPRISKTAAVAASTETAAINRYGFLTESAGSVQVSMTVVCQEASAAASRNVRKWNLASKGSAVPGSPVRASSPNRGGGTSAIQEIKGKQSVVRQVSVPAHYDV